LLQSCPDPAVQSDRALLAHLLDGCGPLASTQLPRSSDGVAELLARDGHAPSAAQRLAVALELARRCFAQDASAQTKLLAPEDVLCLLRPELAQLEVEAFWVFGLSAQGNLLHSQRVSTGTLTASLVHPREVFAPVLLHRCASLVVAHNHPSGDPEPSSDDRATTRRLEKVGRLLGIPLLDHVVIGGESVVSFQQRGWIRDPVAGNSQKLA